MGGGSNEHGDDESGISRVRITSMPDPFFSSSSNWDSVVSGHGGGSSNSQYSSMAMVNPGMSCFSHLEADMPMSLLPFGDCGGGQISHFLGSDMKGESGVLGASSIGKRKQLEAESQWNKKAVEEIQEEPQRGSDQSQKKHKKDQSKEMINKDSSQSEEVPKEDYIHKRARRGQATNSHSLAERVRREKISERMRLLQELVPGCNKITGKAVMLDEIINYVQSLQQQVEFLSMKLATVNPEINIDIDRILAKDLLQSRDRNIPTLGLNPFTGFHETIPNLTTTTNPQYNSLPQTTLESELQNLYQTGFISNPLSMSSFSSNDQLKPEL